MKDKKIKAFLEMLLMILEELLVWIICALSQWISYVGKEIVGEDGTGFLPLDIYSLNPWMVVLSHVLFTVSFIMIWEYLLSKQFRKLLHYGKGWLIVALVLSCIAVLGLPVVGIMVELAICGLFSGLGSDFTFGMILFYPMVLGVIYPLLRTIIRWKKNRNRIGTCGDEK